MSWTSNLKCCKCMTGQSIKASLKVFLREENVCENCLSPWRQNVLRLNVGLTRVKTYHLKTFPWKYPDRHQNLPHLFPSSFFPLHPKCPMIYAVVEREKDLLSDPTNPTFLLIKATSDLTDPFLLPAFLCPLHHQRIKDYRRKYYVRSTRVYVYASSSMYGVKTTKVHIKVG